MRRQIVILGILTATLGLSIETAAAQYGPAVPVAPGGRCPSNYTIQQGMCRPYRPYREGREYRRGYREREYREERDYGYDDPQRYPYGPAVRVAPGGQCPSNYTIQGGMCRPYRGY